MSSTGMPQDRKSKDLPYISVPSWSRCVLVFELKGKNQELQASSKLLCTRLKILRNTTSSITIDLSALSFLKESASGQGQHFWLL